MTSKRKLKGQVERLEEVEKVDEEGEWWEIEAEPEDRMLALALLAEDSDKSLPEMSSREYAEHEEKLKEFVRLSRYGRGNDRIPSGNDFEGFDFVEDFNRILENAIEERGAKG